ncbi:fibronectin domain-containing lipoprotein [Helicobacter fennelliae]|uniref:Fibronectin domain-containing lipoprotein n=1 Tax=Helicobacter fennelliae TaxID=215 RepID=A0A2X3AZR2_9HELI|nr:fibronectin type III domain-containing protein [Helicobacter fennelliae]SQB98418.1 fibronectin domain-containing lipoprotein [Helicobacter fennelliae]STP08523.1 fibronectin domain-containing lipoprotein [Helicobacter fennelliae]STQ84335.1 fibronectin domain-containing lipoprotein [Helicobacter fennelliae]
MKPYSLILFCSILASVLFLGCSNKSVGIGFLNTNDIIDQNLPVIHNIRTLVDVTSVALEWDLMQDIHSVKGFVIYQIQSNKKPKKIATIKNPYSTHYVVNSLLPQTSYSFAIAVLGKDNAISKQSQSVEIKTSFIDPIEQGFASFDKPKSIKLIWSPHPNPSITQYIIQRMNDSGKFLNIATVKNRLMVEFFDTNLSDGKEYSYRIVAQDFDGTKSLPSEVINGKTKNKPQTITSLQASRKYAKKIQLEWGSVAEAKKYEIYYSDTLDGKYNLLGTSDTNSFVDSINQDGVTRFYKVIAIDESGIASDLPKGAVMGETLPPLLVPKIIKSSVQNKHGVIEWEVINNAHVKSYAVYRLTEKTKTPLRFDNTTKTKFVDKDMALSKKYTYWVVAVDENGNESAPSQKIELWLP